MKKVRGDRETGVDIKDSENKSSGYNDEKKLELSGSSLETGSVSEEVGKQSKIKKQDAELEVNSIFANSLVKH